MPDESQQYEYETFLHILMGVREPVREVVARIKAKTAKGLRNYEVQRKNLIVTSRSNRSMDDLLNFGLMS
jgi:hypothetical protein